MSDDEFHGSFGPFKGAVKGPLTMLIIVMFACAGLVAWQVSEGNRAQAAIRDTLLSARASAKSEHDSIERGQQAIVDGLREQTCMLSLPVSNRVAAVAWRGGRQICEYVSSVYLAGKP